MARSTAPGRIAARLRRFLRLLPPGDARRAAIERRVAALERAHDALTLTSRATRPGKPSEGV